MKVRIEVGFVAVERDGHEIGRVSYETWTDMLDAMSLISEF